jgi:hypothetical protein
MPRKSSTNTRALSTRLSKMQKELNPVIQISGTRFASTQNKVPIHRYLNCTYQTDSTAAKLVKGADLAAAGMQDGCRILDFKVVNRTGRRIAVNIPVDSLLCYFGPNGSPAQVQKERWAPLSKFPSISVNVPDVVASTIDTNNSTATLFSVTGTAGVPNETITISFHYIEYV